MTAMTRMTARALRSSMPVALALMMAIPGDGLASAVAPAGGHVVMDVVAVPPPVTVLTGHVMQKDGITPVTGAEVVLTGLLDDTPLKTRSGRSGRYRLRLPAGQYRLQIHRQMEIYKAPSLFRVPAGEPSEIDLLLLPDFEKPTGASSPLAAGPDPTPESPQVVGSVVDMVRAHAARRWNRWAEVLGFLGSLLAVAAAAD